jgi:transcriptional antiterminator NusG
MSLKWYAIQTYSGSELSVKKGIEKLMNTLNMEDKLGQIVVPIEELIEVKNGKKRIIEKSLYPGYAFIEIDLDVNLWQKIQSLPRIGRFIGEQKKPTALSEQDIANIIKANEKKAPKPKVHFEKDELVRIVDGPFANFNAVVDEFDLEHGTLKLNVSIFGRGTPVEISYTQVEKMI